jgi:hypothetical protein
MFFGGDSIQAPATGMEAEELSPEEANMLSQITEKL